MKKFASLFIFHIRIKKETLVFWGTLLFVCKYDPLSFSFSLIPPLLPHLFPLVYPHVIFSYVCLSHFILPLCPTHAHLSQIFLSLFFFPLFTLPFPYLSLSYLSVSSSITFPSPMHHFFPSLANFPFLPLPYSFTSSVTIP